MRLSARAQKYMLKTVRMQNQIYNNPNFQKQKLIQGVGIVEEESNLFVRPIYKIWETAPLFLWQLHCGFKAWCWRQSPSAASQKTLFTLENHEMGPVSETGSWDRRRKLAKFKPVFVSLWMKYNQVSQVSAAYFSTVMDCTLELWATIDLPFLPLLLPSCLSQQQDKWHKVFLKTAIGPTAKHFPGPYIAEKILWVIPTPPIIRA